MNARPESIQLVRLWVEKAEEDFANAEHTLTMTQGCPFGTIGFHCQQCVEKYLKALLTLHAVPFPKTHDLPDLLNRVWGFTRLDIDLAAISLINRYSVEARYPGEWEPITRADAEEALGIARQARQAIRALLPGAVLR